MVSFTWFSPCLRYTRNIRRYDFVNRPVIHTEEEKLMTRMLWAGATRMGVSIFLDESKTTFIMVMTWSFNVNSGDSANFRNNIANLLVPLSSSAPTGNDANSKITLFRKHLILFIGQYPGNCFSFSNKILT